MAHTDLKAPKAVLKVSNENGKFTKAQNKVPPSWKDKNRFKQ